MKAKIIDYDFKGRGLAKEEGQLTFVDKAVIGDLLEIKISKKTKKYSLGEIKNIEKASEDRIKPSCPYFEKCGGCDFLNYKYSKQLEWKKDKISQDLIRIAGLDIELDQLLGMKENRNYRNNIQLKVEDNKIGYYAKDSNEFVEVKKCIMAEKPINQAIEKLNRINNFYNISDIVIRSNYKDELMIILVANGKIKNTRKILSNLLDLKLVGLFENIKTNKKLRFGKKFTKLYGQDFLEDKLGELIFKISPSSFFQVNRRQTEKLYKLASDYLDPKKDESILDMYCGVGTISLSLAEKSKSVLGVEISEKAVENARENARINKIENANFIADKSENIIEKISEQYQDISKIILDPPRVGLHKNLVDQLLKSDKIEKIVYISCNSSTQARDLALLKEKYKLEKISLVDMFANNVHTESVALLIRL